MPIISISDYKPPLYLRNGHANTIYSALVRKVELSYDRERIDTPDGDFLDLDWSCVGSNRLVLVLHGLEGKADRPYVKGMIRQFNREGWDGLALNFRSCSGEMNRKLQAYHSGETGDIQTVIDHVQNLDKYQKIALVGFSLGGNVVLKYLGEKGTNTPKIICNGIAISVPVDLATSSRQLDQYWVNRGYQRRFMRYLNEKIRQKMEQFPDKIQLPNGRFPRNFKEFDDHITAPIFGYKDAKDYYANANSKQHLPDISVPTLLINAKDDSFLTDPCYPYEIAENHKYFHLQVPEYGGHVGFATHSGEERYWSEKRAWEFVAEKS